MQKIIPHLWFDREAKQAAALYTSLFPDSRVLSAATLRETPSGDNDIVAFQVWGHSFMSISAGPLFKFNPSISFMVNFAPSHDGDARQRIDRVWKGLTDGGKVLMPLDKYPYSERYGWVEDRFGLSWQLILTNPEGEPRPTIIPSLLFTGDVYAKAEEATNHYMAVFSGSKRGTIARYSSGQGPDKEGAVAFTDFQLAGQWFAAMDSSPAHGHRFAFNEAVSLMVQCEDQKEIDYYWERLSAVPEAEQCGWLKDEYGVSWQVTPKALEAMMRTGTRAQIDRVTQAFLPMKKFDLAKLRAAWEGR